MHKRSRSALRRRLGFTLVELMISLAVGGIAFTSIYAIGSASTRHFREQQRVANAQTSLRAAMDQIKRDVQRAGFLASPNNRLPQEACGTPPLAITAAAIVAFDDDVPAFKAIVDPTSLNTGSTLDEVFLMGNYTNTGEYAGVTTVGSSSVTVSTTSQSFRRDFNDWTTPDTFNTTAFDRTFRVGRMVRLHSRTAETFHFSSIGSVNGAATVPTIGLNDAIPATCSPTSGWLSVVNTIRYHVAAPTANDDEAARVAGLGAYGLLKRTEVTSNRAGPLLDTVDNQPLDDRTIIDYVVGFNLSFRAAPANIVNWAVVQGLPAETLVSTNPEQIRSVIIDLAVRTPDQDPTMAWPIGPLLQMRTFKVDNTRPGAARVRTAHAEVLLPNLAFKAY